MRHIGKILAAGVVALATGAQGQAITFNGPSAWVTQRNDSITVRAQLDTAQLKKKEVVISVDLVSGKKSVKSLAKKSFKVQDIAGDFAVGPVKQSLVGGTSFIRIGWSIPGTDNKGILAPLGIVSLDKLPPPPVVSVARVSDGADAAAIAAAVKDVDFKTVANVKLALVWNKGALGIVVAAGKMPGTVRFSVDAKNGKNAFLSFADRVVMYDAEKDSVWGVHFSRELSADSIAYTQKPWPNEFKKGVAGDKVVIMVPWYDTGVIPFEERVIGLGITVFGANGAQTAALPAAASFYLPGTWGDYQLGK